MFEQYVDKNIDFFPGNKKFRILFDNVTFKFRLLARIPTDFDLIFKSFSEENGAAFFARQYGTRIDSQLHAINKFGYFSVGLIFEVLNYIKTMYGSSDVIAISNNVYQFITDFLLPLKSFAKNRDRDTFEISNISTEYQVRPYQEEIIKSIIFNGYGRGLFECPTGGGKSFIIANLIWTLHEQFDNSLRYLIFVPNRQLVDQFYKDLLDYGFDSNFITRLTAGLKKNECYNPDAKIIISNRQYLFNNSNKLPKIDVLIADEVHQVSPGSTTFSFVENLNARFKIGCSGTLPREKFKKWSLLGLFGKIMYTEEVTNLQSQGFLSKLKINVLSICDKDVDDNKQLLFNLKSVNRYTEGGDIAFNDAYNSEIEYINNNYEKLYSPILDAISKISGNVLILFDRIEFGKNMFEYAKELKLRNSNIFYIDGSLKVSIREEIRADFEKSNNNILFAESATFSTGINIKNLPTIVFMFSGKSFSKICQAIGRTLRLHKDKDYARLIDVVFNFKYSRKHFKQRLGIYKEVYKKNKPDEIIKITV